MLCGVTATLGSNPSATATVARPHWGRAVLLCLPDLWARSLGVPVGGGPPARSPHASLTARSGRSRGPPWPCRHPPAPRPGPDAAHGCRSLALQSLRYRDQAPPPPAGTAARPSGPSGALHTSGAWCADVCLCVGSKPSQAPPPPTSTAARPSGLSGALHTSGARSLMLLGALACCLARPRHRPPAPRPGPSTPCGRHGGLAC